MKIARVSVLGTGVLGSQIAFQSAYCGLPVRAYDVDEAALVAARGRFEDLARTYRHDAVPGADQGRAEEAIGRIELTSDLAAAAADADLVIEAVPELLDLKRQVYEWLKAVAPAAAIFATNSSTLLPSDLADFTGRPDRFLALHFANRVWRSNTAEVMGTDRTDPQVFEAVLAFAAWLKENYIDEGRLGVATGQGFYSYEAEPE